MKFYLNFLFRPPGYARKFLQLMKITIAFFFVAIIQVSAATYAQTINISQKNITLEEAFNLIRKQTGHDFFYDAQILRKAKPVNLQLRNASISMALKVLLDGQSLDFTIQDGTIIVKEKNFFIKLADRLFAEDEFVSVSGRVSNGNGGVLNGAVVTVKRTKVATTTDVNGLFILRNVKPSDTLMVTFLGYKMESVMLAAKKYFYEVRMQEATSSLDEVVVQAYGTTSKRLTTGNISRITAKEIAVQPIMNPLLSLEGAIPGLVLTPQNGYEGGPLKVEIRGRSAIDNKFKSDPLYIVDGMPLNILDISKRSATPSSGSSNVISHGYDQNDMSLSDGQDPFFNINPSDIESIEVLKDADATAIYGSRGANGVILITTKRGKIGRGQLGLNISEGLKTVTGYWQMLNTPDYLKLRREAFKNDGVIPTIQNAPDLLVWDQNTTTDWQKYAYGNLGHWTNAQADYSGGNEQYTYRFGAGFNRSTDITSQSGINQKGSVSFAFNNHSTNKRFNLGLTTSYNYGELNQIGLGSIATLAPNAPGPFDAAGNLNYAGWGAQRASFPFAALLQPYSSKTNYLAGSLLMSYEISKGFAGRINFGYNSSINDQSSFIPFSSLDPNPVAPAVPEKGSAKFGTTKNRNWIAEPQLEYNGIIGKGAFNVLLGATLQSTTTSALLVQGTNYTTDALLNTITAAGIISSGDSFGQYKYGGVFARIGYNYQNKYLINFNGRRDGSSRFGPANRFGNFGSVGVAWIASDEVFVKSFLPTAVSFVKLRGSYGFTGSDAVGDYAYLARYGNVLANGIPSTPNYAGVPSLVPQLLPNDDFHWQVNKKLELAMDISFFEDKVNLEAVWYRNRCDNQLIAFPTPQFSGFNSVVANSPASVQNSGYELTARISLVAHQNFYWNTGFNIGINENILRDYPDFQQSPFYTRYLIGESLDNRYVYNYLGVDPLTGQYTFEDHNHDGKISANEGVPPGSGNDDRFIVVQQSPKFSGGLNNQFSYKGVSLNLNFAFRRQQSINALTGMRGVKNVSQYYYDNRWQFPGQIALAARPTNNPLNSDNLFGGSNAVSTDASFIRLQTVALGYSFPSKFVKKIGLKALAVSVNAQNLFVLANFKGIDPQMQSFGGLPPVRTIVSGLTCSL